jgi:hypothetical protein
MHHIHLQATPHLDFLHPDFQAYVEPFRLIDNDLERAQAFYVHVRDGFLYDPYHLDLRHNALKASLIITKNRAWCVEKAIVFAAGLRALGIPSRLGYAIVQNHIGVEKLLEALRTHLIVFHGYVDVFVDGKWTKATPAFDQRICALSGVEPLIWDGLHDSLFQEFSEGEKFMEYHHDYGVFQDVPVELMNAEMKKHYPHLFTGEVPNTKRFSFYHEPNF